jgi:uncharacterized protein (TIGR03067 family)
VVLDRHPIKGRLLAALVIAMACTPAFAQYSDAVKEVQGNWSASKAERDGKSAAAVVGNRLTLEGNRFQIRNKGGKSLYGGTFKVDANAKPAAIDFTHAQGKLKGKSWKGIYAIEAGTLTVCDNAGDPAKDRPKAFETKPNSGIVCIDFKRAK